MISCELVLITSVQEHIFSLFEVPEQSFEGEGILLDPCFPSSACYSINSFFFILLVNIVLDS